MNKRKIFIISAVIIASALFAAGAAILIANKNNIPESKKEKFDNTDVSSVSGSFFSEAEDEYYTIKTTPEGKIGVYKSRKEEPVMVLHDILLLALPKFDRKLLNEGITVYSDEELYSLIEDMDS